MLQCWKKFHIALESILCIVLNNLAPFCKYTETFEREEITRGYVHNIFFSLHCFWFAFLTKIVLCKECKKKQGRKSQGEGKKKRCNRARGMRSSIIIPCPTLSPYLWAVKPQTVCIVATALLISIHPLHLLAAFHASASRARLQTAGCAATSTTTAIEHRYKQLSRPLLAPPLP